MQNKWITLSLALVCISFNCLLSGCAGNSNTSDITPTPTVAVITPAPEESLAEPVSPAVETRKIAVTVVNLSSMDAGMFSIIDPVLNAQSDINQLAANGTLSFECNWPVSVKEFQWALYDTNGDLLLESTTDLTDCKDSLSILLSGEETIDDVDVLFD